MNKSDYILKMEKVLHGATKFELIGPSCGFDNTAKVESKIQHQLLQLKKNGLLLPSVYKAIRPTESLRPQLYGLPKTHKEDLPLRPILSMIGSAQHSARALLILSHSYIPLTAFKIPSLLLKKLDSLIYPPLLSFALLIYSVFY